MSVSAGGSASAGPVSGTATSEIVYVQNPNTGVKGFLYVATTAAGGGFGVSATLHVSGSAVTVYNDPSPNLQGLSGPGTVYEVSRAGAVTGTKTEMPNGVVIWQGGVNVNVAAATIIKPGGTALVGQSWTVVLVTWKSPDNSKSDNTIHFVGPGAHCYLK